MCILERFFIFFVFWMCFHFVALPFFLCSRPRVFVFTFMCLRKSSNNNRVIVFGQSTGSGPSDTHPWWYLRVDVLVSSFLCNVFQYEKIWKFKNSLNSIQVYTISVYEHKIKNTLYQRMVVGWKGKVFVVRWERPTKKVTKQQQQQNKTSIYHVLS